MNTIGSRIAYFRKQKQMTQEELAERLSVTAQAVSKWECDTSYPDIIGMQTLAKELGVTVDALLGEERKIPEVKEAAPEMIDRRIVLIEVCAGETKVTTRFPVSAIKKAMETHIYDEIPVEVVMFHGSKEMKLLYSTLEGGAHDGS